MYKCDICGREYKKKIRYGGYTLCSKHMHQLQHYKKFLDNNPRTVNDPNEYIIDKKNNVIRVFLYDRHQDKKGEFIVDIDDLNKIKGRRWRLSHGAVLTGSYKNMKSLTHILLEVDDTDYYHKIDHIDGDTLNNRKSNLRVCTQGENTLNKHYMKRNSTGITGVSLENRPDREANFNVEIRYKGKRYRLGGYVLLIEAAYVRYLAQDYLFGEFSNNDNFKNCDFSMIKKKRRRELEKYVYEKVILKNTHKDK